MNIDLELDFEHGTIEDAIAQNQCQLVAAKKAARRCRERHYQLRRQLNKAKSVVSSLSMEIMSQIFLFTCPSFTSTEDCRYYPPNQFLIGSVCKEWREIAWSTPRLWNNIHIQFRQKSCQTQIELLEEWIERSGNLPLDFYIHSRGLFGKPWEAPPEAFTRVAEVHARWRSYHGHAVLGPAVELKRINATCFPMLETLSLSQPINGLPANNPPDTACEWNLLPAPALRSVSIQGPLKGGNLTVNWGSLTCLTADFFLPRSTNSGKRAYISFDVLTSCTLLTNLKLKLQDSGISVVKKRHRCSFPYLKELSIDGPTFAVNYILGRLTTPSLNELQLTLESVDATIPWDGSLINLTRRSSCKLRSLTICFVLEGEFGYTEEDLLKMLRTLSRDQPIDSLNISTYTASESDPIFALSDDMVVLLTMQCDDDEQKEHLPLLKNFTYSGDISFSLRKYADMINSRLIYQATKSKAYKLHRQEVENGGSDGKDDEYGEPDEEDEEYYGDQLDDSSISKPLNFSVTVENLDWFEKQHPCTLQSFYIGLERASTRGNKFTFKYGYCREEECDHISIKKV